MPTLTSTMLMLMVVQMDGEELSDVADLLLGFRNAYTFSANRHW